VKRTRDVAGKTTLVFGQSPLATAKTLIPHRRTGKTVLGSAVLAIGALGLSACSAISPTVIGTYPASDGVGADLPGTQISLRNFLAVGAQKGAPAEVIGAVVNDGQTAVQVLLQAAVGDTAQPTQARITVGPGSIVQLGPGQPTDLAISDLAVQPGGVLGLTAMTADGGRTDLQIPVVLPAGNYTSVTPAATPTETPTPTDTPSDAATSTDAPTSTAAGQPTSKASASATAGAKSSSTKRKRAASTATPTPTTS
jgi:hypothetical protein